MKKYPIYKQDDEYLLERYRKYGADGCGGCRGCKCGTFQRV